MGDLVALLQFLSQYPDSIITLLIIQAFFSFIMFHTFYLFMIKPTVEKLNRDYSLLHEDLSQIKNDISHVRGYLEGKDCINK